MKITSKIPQQTTTLGRKYFVFHVMYLTDKNLSIVIKALKKKKYSN